MRRRWQRVTGISVGAGHTAAEIDDDFAAFDSGFSSGIPRKVADSYASPAREITFATSTTVIPRASA